MSGSSITLLQRRGTQNSAHLEALRKQMVDSVFEALKQGMKRSDSESKEFICDRDIRSAWSEDSICKVLYPENWSSTEIGIIRTELIKVLSILVYTASHICLQNFRSWFFDALVNRRDRNLPFKESQLDFLENAALRNSICNKQFSFIPTCIQISSSPEPKVINDNLRLPFENVKKKIGNGGYGEVSQVTIPAGYLKQEDGGVWETSKLVACKQFPLHEDFVKEAENLRILKESLTEHKKIVKHLATIIHRSKQYILLPWAAHLDLELFLHRGIDPSGYKIYDFDLRFPQLQNHDLTSALLHQLYLVAHALDWLHTGIEMEQSHNKIFFAHMDLKPGNILVDDDPDSPIGRWMLSDFGISVFKEDTNKQDSEYVSILDYYSQVTIKTRPKRGEGTYQAPEVQTPAVSGRIPQAASRQEGIGRKSDIWSFGCIFSEVLVFGLGKDTLVKDFQKMRQGKLRDDYFYTEASNTSLTPDLQINYQVRPWIVDWLLRLPEKYVHPYQWLDCCVATILGILVIDPKERPDARRLVNLISHVAEHLRTSRFGDGPLLTCPARQKKERYVQEMRGGSSATHTGTFPDAPWSNSQSPPTETQTRTPKIVRRSTSDEEVILNNGDHSPGSTTSTHPLTQTSLPGSSPARAPISSIPPNTQSHSLHLPPSATTYLHPTRSPELSPPYRESSPGLSPPGSTPPIRPKPMPQSHSSETGSEASTSTITNVRAEAPDVEEITASTLPEDSIRLLSTHQKPDSAHGIVVKPDKQRNLLPYNPVTLKVSVIKRKKQIFADVRRTGKVIQAALPSSGDLVAYLVESKIHIFKINFLGQPFLEVPCLQLPEDNGWKQLVVSGSYLVAWGHSSTRGRKLVYLKNLDEENEILEAPTHEKVASLKCVALSQEGVAAFVCEETILVTNFGSRSSREQKLEIPLSPQPGQTFTHAAFNDNGNLLYAWAYGQSLDHLYVWRIQHGIIYGNTDSEGHYHSLQRGDPKAYVMPYNAYEGCIIEANQKNFFPAQIRSSLRGGTDALPRISIMLPNVLTACIYQDHSMVTIEKEIFHRRARVKEYEISYGSNHTLERLGKEVCVLETGRKPGSIIRAVNSEDSIVLIVANLDGVVEIVKMVPVS